MYPFDICILILTMQGLANGFPLSAVISRKELTDKLPAGSMGGTYAGNAVSCAAAVASADVMKEEKILENVDARCVPTACLSTKVLLPCFRWSRSGRGRHAAHAYIER